MRTQCQSRRRLCWRSAHLSLPLIRINGVPIGRAYNAGMDHWPDIAKVAVLYLIVLLALMVGELVWNGAQLPRTVLTASEVSGTGEP